MPAERLLGGTPWAWQDTVSTGGGGLQRLRVVLDDGRRVDAAVRGRTVLLPSVSPDNAARFDLALAAVRFGRGADVIGLHLVLGVVRGVLEQWMLVADQQTGATHHRSGTATDVAATRAHAALAGPLGPATSLRVAALVDEVSAAVAVNARTDTTAGHRAAPTDWSPLEAIVGSGGPTIA